MRFITLSALFLFASTTLAAPLDLSFREEDTYSSLASRGGVVDTGAASGLGNGKPERIYTGRDVLNGKGEQFGKEFHNTDHQVAGQPGTLKPIPAMFGPGHEHPMSGATSYNRMKKDHKRSPARIISQAHPSGFGHQHIAVTARDQTRPSTQAGAKDHFQISRRSNPMDSVISKIKNWIHQHMHVR